MMKHKHENVFKEICVQQQQRKQKPTATTEIAVYISEILKYER